ncbi:MAG: 2-oxo acid dehydrogenase subunit E2 [Gammaproteobacteria bacterium]|nr:2-oxo acid dehydrogenase subunit E2 [Gammaproteobacteria bacterium]
MGQFSFKTPDVGEGIVEVELISWSIAVGDEVAEDQPIADVMTDKANVELTSPVSGRVVKLACPTEEMVAVGAELVLFEVEDEANLSGEEVVGSEAVPSVVESPEVEMVPAVEPEKSVPPVKDAPVSPAIAKAFGGKALASPAVRRRALKLGIDLSEVPGCGPAGRVSHDDLDRFEATASMTAGVQPRIGSEQIKVTGLRRVIARKMQESKRTIPHFSYVEEVDLTELESLRLYLNANRSEGQPKLTLLPFLMQALVGAVERFPEVNATYDDEANIITRYAGVHIGIATATDQGLKVPVVKHAESLNIWNKAAEMQRLAGAARDSSASTEALSGSTITITSLGKLGGLVSTPVLNKPEVAIIGVNKAEDRAVVRDGQMVIRHMMNLSSSFDHRIVDGHVAAQFIQAIKAMLEHPATLFMANSGPCGK